MHSAKCSGVQGCAGCNGPGKFKVQKRRGEHGNGMRFTRNVDFTDGIKCSPDDKNGRCKLKKHCSSQLDSQSCSKASTGGSTYHSPSRKGTVYAHSPVLFGEVAHSRCPEYGSSYDGTEEGNYNTEDGNENEAKRAAASITTEYQAKGDGSDSGTPLEESDIPGDSEGRQHHHAVNETIGVSDSRIDTDKTQSTNELPQILRTNIPETAEWSDPYAQPSGTLFTTHTTQFPELQNGLT